MKANHSSSIPLAARLLVLFFAFSLALFCCLDPLPAEDWTTIDGKVYSNVKVLKAEPDAVTIIYRDGGALIPLANLPADLQQRFHYDPVAAKAAMETRAKGDAASAQALQAEMTEAAKIKAAADAKEKALKAQIAAEKRAADAQSNAYDFSDALEPNKKEGGHAFAPPVGTDHKTTDKAAAKWWNN